LFIHPPRPEFYSLSLHDALPICPSQFSLRLEMLSFSELIFSFPVASLASRSVISPVLLAQQLVQAFRSVLTLGLVLHRARRQRRSEEHTSELQSLAYLVCRLLLE